VTLHDTTLELRTPTDWLARISCEPATEAWARAVLVRLAQSTRRHYRRAGAPVALEIVRTRAYYVE